MFLTWKKPLDRVTVNAVVENEILIDWNCVCSSLHEADFLRKEFVVLGSICTDGQTQYFACIKREARVAKKSIHRVLGVDTIDFYLDSLSPPVFRQHRDAFFMLWCEVIKALHCEAMPQATMVIRHSYNGSASLEAQLRQQIADHSNYRIESSHGANGVFTVVVISNCIFTQTAVLEDLANAVAISIRIEAEYDGMEVDIDRTRKSIR